MLRKIVITGAGGFIGSHLLELCVQRGYKVKAFIRYNSKNSWGWLDQISCKNKIEVISGDIRDYDSVYSCLKGSDSVFHLAALIGIPYSYVSPFAYIRTNIEGTYNILEASRQLDMKNIIITSTSETYGTARQIPINEQHPIVGQSPYSATKIAADQLALSYYHSFNLAVKIVRPFNTYGPRQSARAIIPAIIIQILNGKKEINLGNIYPTRDFTYVKDIASGFIEIAESKKLFGEITNIGSGSEISIKNLAILISSLMNKKLRIIIDSRRSRPKKSEVERLCCDNAKLKKYTNWKLNYDIKRGLQETIDWMKNNYKQYKADIYNV